MPEEFPESDMFVLLAKRRRRLALEVIQESQSALPTEELTNRLVDREFENPSADDVQSVRLTLRHNHLPRLDDSNVIEYDATEGTVHPGVNFDTLLRMLERARAEDLAWSDG